jgi:hypothetical protein
MRRNFIKLLFMSLAIMLVTSCEKDDSETGRLTLSITDAPIDMSTVEGVYLTINEIQYHKGDGEWESFDEFEAPQTFNILELTNGASELMGSFELEAGNYTQLRFLLDAPVLGDANPTNPGCYIRFSDQTEEPLFVPSGYESGWKGVGAFRVPSNGEVAITADFDARKSVMKQGANENYILKPTIRLIVDNQAGQIVGGLTNQPAGVDLIIYAYEDGTYSAEEAADPTDNTTPRFPNAITSDFVETDSYHLTYLAQGTYDLVITTSTDGVYGEVLGIFEDVVVESEKTTSQPIDISTL